MTEQQPPSKRPFVPKNRFSRKDDDMLRRLVKEFGQKNWIAIAEKMEGRTPRQCRERWINYVNPSIKKRSWTKEEDKLLEKKYEELGPKWKIIKTFFQHRSTNMIKNRLGLLERHRVKGALMNAREAPSYQPQEKTNAPDVVEKQKVITPEINISQIFDQNFTSTEKEWFSNGSFFLI